MMKSLPSDRITISDPFWSRHVDLVRSAILPYQWNAMNDLNPDAEPSHCIENFRIAAGLAEGEFYGFVFQDSDLAKWLEAAGCTLACHPDPELEQRVDEVIDLVVAAQQPDGYLNTYFTIKAPDQRWKNLMEGHELYTAGHFMEAAVACYEGTGKRKLLDAMIRFADLMCDTFGPGPGRINGYPGHEEIEIGLVRLYRATGERKYLDLAKYFVDARGVGENYFLREMARPDFRPIFGELKEYDTSYSQSHLPVREQDTAEGHAVRAVYLYAAMADLADECGDDSLLEACKRLWNNIVDRRMYVTGGIGSSGILERFTTDFDLPNDIAYSESCAAIGLALFGLRMNHITRDASYMDVAERALYNTVLSGIALDGKSFFYVNPLEVWPDSCMPFTSRGHVKPVRQPWFACACCPPNIARTLASLGQYIYAVDDSGIYVNLYVSGTAEAEWNGHVIRLEQETRFPADGQVTLRVTGAPASGVTVALRIPDYGAGAALAVNGSPVEYEVRRGYAHIRLDGDGELTLSIPVAPRFTWANPAIRANAGRVCVERGPLVYCLEEEDNGKNLSALFVNTAAPLSQEESDLFGGSVLITARGKRLADWRDGAAYGQRPPQWEKADLRFVPYAFWCNRTPGEMAVWIKEYSESI